MSPRDNFQRQRLSIKILINLSYCVCKYHCFNSLFFFAFYFISCCSSRAVARPRRDLEGGAEKRDLKQGGESLGRFAGRFVMSLLEEGGEGLNKARWKVRHVPPISLLCLLPLPSPFSLLPSPSSFSFFYLPPAKGRREGTWAILEGEGRREQNGLRALCSLA